MEPLSLFDENEVMLKDAKELCNKASLLIKPLLQEFIKKKGYKSREVESLVFSVVSTAFAEHRLLAAAERRKAAKAKKVG